MEFVDLEEVLVKESKSTRGTDLSLLKLVSGTQTPVPPPQSPCPPLSVSGVWGEVGPVGPSRQDGQGSFYCSIQGRRRRCARWC